LSTVSVFWKTVSATQTNADCQVKLDSLLSENEALKKDLYRLQVEKDLLLQHLSDSLRQENECLKRNLHKNQAEKDLLQPQAPEVKIALPKQHGHVRKKPPKMATKNSVRTKNLAKNGPLDLVPNVLLAGAPKCGTTALFTSLCRHPDIACTRKKEPEILNRNSFSLTKARHRYQKQFVKLHKRPKILLDGSVTAGLCPKAPGRLKALNPDARVVFVFKANQRDRIQSWYAMTTVSKHETRSLQTALVEELDRIDRCLPPSLTTPHQLQSAFESCVVLSELVCDWPHAFKRRGKAPGPRHYISFGAVDAIVRMWRREFGHEQMAVYRMDENVSSHVADLIKWFDLPSGKKIRVPVVHVNRDKSAIDMQVEERVWQRVEAFYRRMGEGVEALSTPPPLPEHP